jgi:hypothetical protein
LSGTPYLYLGVPGTVKLVFFLSRSVLLKPNASQVQPYQYIRLTLSVARHIWMSRTTKPRLARQPSTGTARAKRRGDSFFFLNDSSSSLSGRTFA